MRLLLLFLKEPLPGEVKTRLGHTLGAEQAAIVYRAMLRLLLIQLSGLEQCRLRFCYAPDDAHDAIRFWLLSEIMEVPEIQLNLEHIDFRPQGEGDLGARLTRAARQSFEEGYQKIAFIGSDCIEISSRWIQAAFAQLNDRHDAVIGPTPDGGYHLLAMQRYLPTLFEEIPWSTPATCQVTTDRAAQEDISLYRRPARPAGGGGGAYRAGLAGPVGTRLQKTVETLEKDF
ncbi:MAG: TIGR04282 family arsenosugar biosynthesis glycosyltransferase [Roseibacillus sp.]|nr:TIGR04282 family arsenosugar biosynthesis glycosyltransferase [Roseibacillus sp.]